MYRFDFDPERKLIIATLEGFWTVAMVERYISDLADFARKAGAGHPSLNLLVRAENMAVQPQEVGEAFTAAEKRFADSIRPGRIAVLAGSVLTKMQASRTFQDPGIRIFFDEKEAFYWLSKPAAEDDGASAPQTTGTSETSAKASGEKPSPPPAAAPHPPQRNQS